jgi:predicted helicase
MLVQERLSRSPCWLKRKGHDGRATIRYHDIGDYLTREQKLDIISGFGSHQSVPWQTIEPNEHHDWINQRSGDFGSFVPLNELMMRFSCCAQVGCKLTATTGHITPVKRVLADNMEKMIDFTIIN